MIGRYILFFLLPFPLCALEFNPQLAPWFGNVWEFEATAAYHFQHYNTVQSPDRDISHHSNDHFAHFALGISPWPRWDVELELLLASTASNSFGYEAFRATGRYLLFDDILCDPFSLATGVTLTCVADRFLKDFSIPFHGNVNAEFHIAIGKEWAYCTFLSCTENCTWMTRLWALVGIGVANRGLPWGHGIIAAEYNYWDRWQAGVYSDLLYGFGSKDIIEPFKGYASIDHQSVDLGGFFRYRVFPLGSLKADYAYRIHAHNFPEHAHIFTLALEIPFSL